MSTFERMDLTQFDGATPGPWWAECTSQRGHTVWAARCATGSMQIAACGYAGFDQYNAALIAAAPDILAALRAAYAEIDRLRAEARNRTVVCNSMAHGLEEYQKDVNRLTAELAALREQVPGIVGCPHCGEVIADPQSCFDDESMSSTTTHVCAGCDRKITIARDFLCAQVYKAEA